MRYLATINTVAGQRNYSFSGLNTGVAATTGVQGVIHVRSIMLDSGATGFVWLVPRPWPWFQLYHLNVSSPVNAQPTTWAQFGQGSAGVVGAGGTGVIGIGSGSMISGSFYLDPPPNSSLYTLTCDCVCYPIALAADTDVEAIPYLWSDAVPYFAAYLALMSAQTQARAADALRMKELYEEFVRRARQFANPAMLRPQYAQAVDPVMMQPQRQQAQGA